MHARIQSPAGQLDLLARESRPAPKSPLISERNLKIDLASFVWEGKSVEVLTHRSTPDARVLASIVRTSARDGGSGTTYFHWFPAVDSSVGALTQDLTALEYLYPLAVNEMATASFRFETAVNGVGRIFGKGGRITHPQLLEKIARTRECIVESLGQQAPASLKRWRVVTVEPGSIDVKTQHVVARLREGNSALEGALVFFRKEPHMECSAMSDQAGLARCELQDTHGHHDHREEGRQPVVMTYPGDIQKTSILLPTTVLLRMRP